MPPLCADSCDDSSDDNSERLTNTFVFRNHSSRQSSFYTPPRKRKRTESSGALSPNTLFSAPMEDFMGGLKSLMGGEVGAKTKDNEILSLRKRITMLQKEKRR